MNSHSQSHVERKSLKLPNGTIFTSTTWRVAPEAKEENERAKSAASKPNKDINGDDEPVFKLDEWMGQMSEQLANADVLMSKFQAEHLKAAHLGSETNTLKILIRVHRPDIPKSKKFRTKTRTRSRNIGIKEILQQSDHLTVMTRRMRKITCAQTKKELELGYPMRMEFGSIANMISMFSRAYATKNIGKMSLRKRFLGTGLQADLIEREGKEIVVMEAFPALASKDDRDTLTAEQLLERDHAATAMLLEARLHRFISDRITSNPFYFLRSLHPETGDVGVRLRRIFHRLDEGR